MDLQSMNDKAVTSRNACPPDNFRAYSPQISDVSRGQPDTSGLAHAPPVSRTSKDLPVERAVGGRPRLDPAALRGARYKVLDFAGRRDLFKSAQKLLEKAGSQGLTTRKRPPTVWSREIVCDDLSGSSLLLLTT